MFKFSTQAAGALLPRPVRRWRHLSGIRVNVTVCRKIMIKLNLNMIDSAIIISDHLDSPAWPVTAVSVLVGRTASLSASDWNQKSVSACKDTKSAPSRRRAGSGAVAGPLRLGTCPSRIPLAGHRPIGLKHR